MAHIDLDLEILSDVELDVGFHSEFDVYLSDVELARIAQANHFNYRRFMVHAIRAHRQVLNRRRLVEDNRRRVSYLRSELIRVLGLFPELRDEIIVVAMDQPCITIGVRSPFVVATD
jgi:hypothetical protein